MTDFVLDRTRSQIHIRTFAEGLMARLAHDLDLVATDVQGTATSTEGEASAHLEIALAGLAVAGVLGKDGIVDTRVLSPGDQWAILEKMHADVFRVAPGGVVIVDAAQQGTRAMARLQFPNGRTVEAPVQLQRPEAERVVGEVALSLEAIGAVPVKGPMNAFRVKDRVIVAFDLVFVPAPAGS